MQSRNNWDIRQRILSFSHYLIARSWDEHLVFWPIFTPKHPSSVSIELTNACNLSCIMCGNPYMKRQRGFMEYSLYCNIVDDCVASGVENIRLHTTGETLLHPDLLEMLKYARMKDRKVWISTNGLLLTEHLAREIIDTGIEEVRFSIEGVDKETYERIRRGGSYQTLVTNLQTFKRLRDEKGHKPAIGINTVLMTLTEPSLERFFEFYSQFADYITVFYMQGQAGLANKIEQWSLLPWDPNKQFACRLLWTLFSVTYDGKVPICCADNEAEVIVGDIQRNSILEIWRSPKFESYRHLHRKGCKDQIGICRTCTLGYVNTIDHQYQIAERLGRPYRRLNLR